MTQEALKLALEALEWCHGGEPCGTAEAIAAIKEALAQTQEPVVCCQQYDTCLQPCTPRGEHLAQRTWVGLTDEEQQQAYEQWQNDGWGVFYNAIEAKLKEKNNG